MKVYVAGPMTGYPGLNFDNFHRVTARLRRDGHEVINPAEVNPDLNADWADCMAVDIKLVADCDAIWLLRGWEDSPGAIMEWLVANRLSRGIYYEDNDVAKQPNYSGVDGKVGST